GLQDLERGIDCVGAGAIVALQAQVVANDRANGRFVVDYEDIPFGLQDASNVDALEILRLGEARCQPFIGIGAGISRPWAGKRGRRFEEFGPPTSLKRSSKCGNSRRAARWGFSSGTIP